MSWSQSTLALDVFDASCTKQSSWGRYQEAILLYTNTGSLQLALDDAIRHGSATQVRYALNSVDATANIDTGSVFGIALCKVLQRILDKGCSSRQESILSLLLERGADVNIMSGNPLALAACSRNTIIVSMLLARGADANIVGGHYGTALIAAVSRGGSRMVSLLLNRGRY